MSTPAATAQRQVPAPRPRLLFASLSGYALSWLGPDLMAALTLAAIAVPEQMATARLGGLPPEAGFLAFVAGTVAFAALGANRFLSAGADSTIAPIFAGSLAAWAAAGTPGYAGMAAALALAVGIILVLGGVCRLGWVADLLSVPVTTGFLAGISVHIIISQLPALLGLPQPGGPLPAQAAAIARRLGHTNLDTLGLGLGVLCLTLGAERISARLPAALLGLAAATAAVLLLGLEAHGVKVLDIASGTLPRPALPSLTLADLFHLIPLAVIIALVVMLQTAATTRSFVSDPGMAPAIDRDFIGIGAGSILAGLLGAFPVNASPPRTAIIRESGGRSQLAGLLAAAVIVLLVAYGSRLLAHVPEAALAGVLVLIGLRIFRVAQIAEIYRRTFGEFALVIITMVAIVALPIDTGVGIGVVLSLLHGMWTTTRAQAIEFEQVPGTSIWWAPGVPLKGERLPAVAVVAFQAPLSFLNAYRFKQGVIDIIERHPGRLELVVLEASSIVAIDFTASRILGEVIGRCRAAGATFAVARLESVRAQAAFRRFGLIDLLGEDRVFLSVDAAIAALAKT